VKPHLLNQGVLLAAKLNGIDFTGGQLVLDCVHPVHQMRGTREITTYFRCDELSDLGILQLYVLLCAGLLRLSECRATA
jgi:hypothetical protein